MKSFSRRAITNTSPAWLPQDSKAPTWALPFLPIGIGSLIAGWFGGKLIHHFGEVTHQPEKMWWAVIAVGVLTALLLWIYDRTLMPAEAKASVAS